MSGADPKRPFTQSETGAATRVGVALGGGSARGFAHIGALASLERHGVFPDVVVGASFGAVVGALYATGQPLETLAEKASALRRRDVIPHIADIGFHRGALFSGDRLETFFERLLDGRCFADLEREFAVVTTDVCSGECVLLQSGSLARALRASSSLPGVFAPVEIGGRRLIDGGIGSPIPASTLDRFDVDLAIGIGAGMEYDRSTSIVAMRRMLVTGVGRGVHGFLGSRGAGSAYGRLGLGLALTADSWLYAEGCEHDGADPVTADHGTADHGTADHVTADHVTVQTRPPVTWLGFHRAADAIAAGAAALDRSMPAIVAAHASAGPA